MLSLRKAGDRKEALDLILIPLIFSGNGALMYITSTLRLSSYYIFYYFTFKYFNIDFHFSSKSASGTDLLNLGSFAAFAINI